MLKKTFIISAFYHCLDKVLLNYYH